MPDSDSETEISTVSIPQQVVLGAGQVVYSIKIEAMVIGLRGSPIVRKEMYPTAAAAGNPNGSLDVVVRLSGGNAKRRLGVLLQAYRNGDGKLLILASYVLAKRS